MRPLLDTDAAGLADGPQTPSATSHSGFDFSRIPVHPGAPNDAPFDVNDSLVTEGGGKRSERDYSELLRHAAGPGPDFAPPIVHEVLQGRGQPLPGGVRRDMESRLGHNFADVRIHTDERAARSAEAVAAHAYTVGRHIVFAAGLFDPASAQGRRLLTHELTHAASHPPGVPAPSGGLRISRPAEAGERQAVSVAEGSAAAALAPAAPRLFRQGGGLVALTDVTVNQHKVTVPPPAGLSFLARKTPANASGVTLSVVGDNAAIATGTVVNQTTGAITVDPGQTGGSAHVLASQNATAPDGSSNTATATDSFNFTAIPSGISSTTASPAGASGLYGGAFTHTFTSPAGGQTALEGSHVNEQFAGASGTTLTITGALGTFAIQINDPNSATAGWDLDSSGTMAGPDQVDWSSNADARAFVTNASNPSPNKVLPQELLATQNFRNLTFPNQTYGAAAVTSTTHRRALEDRSSQLKAVTSSNATEVVDDYAGPTVFRGCTATPSSIPVAAPASPGTTAPAPTTSTITVNIEGQQATATFSVRQPDLGCTITPGGILTPGATPGTVTVRAGDSTNFDETTVTLTQPAPPAPTNPTPQP